MVEEVSLSAQELVRGKNHVLITSNAELVEFCPLLEGWPSAESLL